MKFARISLLLVLTLALTACSGGPGTGAGGGNGGSGAIQLSPSGTAAHPVDESINESFALTATEGGYGGNFTARKISGQCFEIDPPTTSSGYWIVAPKGLYCVGGSKGDAEEFQVTDTAGRSAVTYIHTI
jgi:hypothetical protein